MDFFNLLEEDQEAFERCSDRFKLLYSDVETIKLYQWNSKFFIFKRNIDHLIYEGNLYRKIYINERDIVDFTLLMRAAGRGYVEIVRILIEVGANIDAYAFKIKRVQPQIYDYGNHCIPRIPNDGSDRHTSLSLSIEGGHKEIVKMLLHAGVHISDSDYSKLKEMTGSSQERRRKKALEMMEKM